MKLDPNKTAFLTLDLQKGIFGLLPDSERVMPIAAKAVAFARQNQFRIIHVGWDFSKGTLRFRILNPRFCGSNRTIFSSKAQRPRNFMVIFFIRTTS
jgi:nicotinamidase-related amidase